MKTHYEEELWQPHLKGKRTLCTWKKIEGNLKATKDIEKVDCKRCIYLLKRNRVK